MSPAPANTPIKLKLLPAIAEQSPTHAEAHGLLFSTFLGVLVWNDHFRPNRALRAIPRDPRLVRLPVNASLRAAHRRMARARARAQGMSVNAYLEALLAAQLAHPRAALSILHAE